VQLLLVEHINETVYVLLRFRYLERHFALLSVVGFERKVGV
jgi:hypothetical protein